TDDTHPERGKQQVVMSGHLADDHQRRDRSLGCSGEETSHAHDDEAGRVRNHSRPEPVHQDPDRTSPAAADHHRRAKTPPEPPLPMVSPVVTIFPRATINRIKARFKLPSPLTGTVKA